MLMCMTNGHFLHCRVILAYIMSGFPLGRALSNLPDMGKAQKAATAILSLLSRRSKIDASYSGGRKLVSFVYSMPWNSSHT